MFYLVIFRTFFTDNTAILLRGDIVIKCEQKDDINKTDKMLLDIETVCCGWWCFHIYVSLLTDWRELSMLSFRVLGESERGNKTKIKTQVIVYSNRKPFQLLFS